jgi:type I restriction enzyme R subunit
MYLDKPMRDHILLQAIARVNRPYEDSEGQKKPQGYIVDFVGIFEKMEHALAFDSVDEVQSVIQNIDVLKEAFAKEMTEVAPQYLSYAKGWNDKALEQAIQHFREKEVRETFFEYMKTLQALYEIIAPDSFLRSFLQNYEALSELYNHIREAYSTHAYIDREITKKTQLLIREHSSSYAVQAPQIVYELTPETLAALKSDIADDHIKVLNLKKAITATVDKQADSQPHMRSIGERADSILLQYEERLITTQEALEKLFSLSEEELSAQTRQQTLGLHANSYAIYKATEPYKEITAQQAQDIDALFTQYADYTWSEKGKSELRNRLYHYLNPLLDGNKMIELVNTLMKLVRV